MRPWKGLLWAVEVAVLCGVGCFAFFLYHLVAVTVPDAYAVEWVADMVIRYMDTHDGAWPRGWDDLREPYKEVAKRAGRPWRFEELRGRVEVDWNADPSALSEVKLNDDQPPFRVIWLRDGSEAHWSSTEPNRLIWNYLQQRRTKSGQGHTPR